MERMRRAEAANAPPVEDSAAASGTTISGGLKSQAASANVTGRRKTVPMSDSFMAARLAPTAAPLTTAVEKKVSCNF